MNKIEYLSAQLVELLYNTNARNIKYLNLNLIFLK